MILATRPRIVVADPLAQTGIDLLRHHTEVLLAADADALHGALPTSDALIVRSRTQVTAQVLDRGPGLRIVGRAGIGVDNIDVQAATDRGVLVVNAPLGNVRSTAEHTVALLFALARRVVAADAAVREGRWKANYEGMQLAGKQLGVIGAGKVGMQVAAIAAALGLHVVAHDPYLPAEVWGERGLESMGLDELLATSDIVTIHVPLMPATRNLLDAARLERMKPGALLINCARGGLVDEQALAAALASGSLAGAAIDVFVEEPPANSPLLTAPNAILTPHVAASTREAQVHVSADIAAQIVDFFAGRPVAYPVNPSVLGES